MPDYTIAFDALRAGGFSIPQLKLGQFDVWDVHVQRLAAAIDIPNLFTDRMVDPPETLARAHLRWIKFYVIDLFLESTKDIRDATGPADTTKYMDEPHNVYKYIRDCCDKIASK